MKVTKHVTIEKSLMKWMDTKIEEGRFASYSHAVNVALMELRKKETVKL